MATVRASCPTCGDVETTTRALQLLCCTTTGDTCYAFVCPCCRMRVTKEATDQIIRLLADAGVKTVTWQLPAELEEIKTGPVVTHDDLLAFHFSLQDAGWLEAQVEALRAIDRHSGQR